MLHVVCCMFHVAWIRRAACTVHTRSSMSQVMSAEKWVEAVNRIGVEWLKGTDTKSGKRRVHTAAPLVELIATAEAAQNAEQNTQQIQPAD